MMLSSSSPLQELNEGWFVCLLDRGVPFRCVCVGVACFNRHTCPYLQLQIVDHFSRQIYIVFVKMQEEVLYVKKLSENATIPVRGSVHAAGYDLFR